MKVTRENEIQILKAGPEDAAALSELCINTFRDTYLSHNTAEDMALYTDTYFTLPVILKELQSEEITIYIARIGEKMIGYIKLELGNTSYMVGKGLEISRYYVLKEHQRLKVGKNLMNNALDLAFKSGCSYIWLGVWKKNEKAIEIYKHQGFKIAGETIFVLGNDPQEDFIMIKELI